MLYGYIWHYVYLFLPIQHLTPIAPQIDPDFKKVAF